MNSSPQRISIAALAPQPWKNGAGLTREIAVAPQAAGHADFDWRISLAEVERDAPFSAFPGIDRCITLLRGAGMRLASADGTLEHRLDKPLTPFRFPGELALNATVIDGSCSDFNVMTRRGAWHAEVSLACGAREIAAADVALLLGVAGRWQVDAAAADRDAAWELGPDEALLWRAGCSALRTRPLESPAGALLQVRLCQDRR